MVSVAPIAPPLLIGEQRVVLRNITWHGYQQILEILGNKRAARLTFDRGTLEITKPFKLDRGDVTRFFVNAKIGIDRTSNCGKDDAIFNPKGSDFAVVDVSPTPT
jgi:hypothetical protein